MTSSCIDDCVNINNDVICVGTGTSYAKIHKWPTAEAEFVRSLSHGNNQRRTASVDSILCRQMYLRSYKFSRKEEIEESDHGGDEDADEPRNDRRCFGGRKKKEVKRSIETSKTVFRKAILVKLLFKCFSCTFSSKVNV